MTAAALLAFVSAAFAALLAIVVLWHGRRSVAIWALSTGMAVLAAESVCSGLAANSILLKTVAQRQSYTFLAMSLLPGVWLLFSLTYARGNYLEFLARWRFALAVAFIAPVVLVFAFPEEVITAIGYPSEGGPLMLRLGFAGIGLHLLLLLGAVLVLMNLERTFRASIGTIRWRIKFMALGLGVLFAVRAYTSSQALLFHGGELAQQGVNSAALIIACLLIIRSLFRAGHFEVSIYPSQSMLRHSFTILLAGAYLLIVGVFAKVVAFLGGDAAFPIKAFFVLVTLVLLTMLLLSDRVRLFTKRFVSRHFQRPIYDYRSVWRTFTEGTARCVEQDELCSAVAKLNSDIFQALSVNIWLVDDRKERLAFAASTSLSQAAARYLVIEPKDAAEVIAALSAHPDPMDIDSCREPWAVPLRLSHPEEFRKGGNRICVPMIAGGELLGILTLGDRVGGAPFSVQDLDLLKSVSDQAASGLLNIQLSQRLSQAKQLEAFQAMSTFFVHDLKNTASTLSLMLQNLPVHFNDPRFREDALRGVSKTVTHINDLISRLSLLRQAVTTHRVEANLNDLVAEALGCLVLAPQVELVKELRPLSRLSIDPTQMRNVVTNLVLNARDAVGSDGRIRVETSQANGWVVLAVADNGCGMSPDFVERCLFRPFQTTKKQGIGIGMFQSRMIVEAHHGQIKVETHPGQGTTFRVLLPITSSQTVSPS